MTKPTRSCHRAKNRFSKIFHRYVAQADCTYCTAREVEFCSKLQICPRLPQQHKRKYWHKAAYKGHKALHGSEYEEFECILAFPPELSAPHTLQPVFLHTFRNFLDSLRHWSLHRAEKGKIFLSSYSPSALNATRPDLNADSQKRFRFPVSRVTRVQRLTNFEFWRKKKKIALKHSNTYIKCSIKCTDCIKSLSYKIRNRSCI